MVEDYIELEDGCLGIVWEMLLCFIILEIYDGKDIMVFNEKFIIESFINWFYYNNK